MLILKVIYWNWIVFLQSLSYLIAHNIYGRDLILYMLFNCYSFILILLSDQQFFSIYYEFSLDVSFSSPKPLSLSTSPLDRHIAVIFIRCVIQFLVTTQN